MPLYKAQAAGAAAGAAVGILGLSVKNIGIRAIFTEVVETVFEEITGVPIINDPIDIGQKGAKEGSEAIGKRVKNRLPDKGNPNTAVRNKSGTTFKKYGKDGNVQKEYNKGHGKNAPKNEQGDHIHDYKPNPKNPSGSGEKRFEGRPPKKGEYIKDFLFFLE